MVQAKTSTAGGSPQIIQTTSGAAVAAMGGKTGIPQGATIVKLVNAPGAAGISGTAQSPKIVKSIGGSGMVTLAKPGQTLGGKQTIVINKPGAGGTTLKGKFFSLLSMIYHVFYQFLLNYMVLRKLSSRHEL